jgi:peptide/nickel transport system permease protein
MTEQSAGRTIESKDYWDIVLGQLAKRPSVLIAGGILVFLYAVAIYAPLLANDRPLVFEGTDYGNYRGAHRLIRLAANDLAGKATKGQAGFETWRADEVAKGETYEASLKENWEEKWAAAPKSFAEWLAVDHASLSLRVGFMRKQLLNEHHALLDETLAAADNVVEVALTGEPEDVEVANEQLQEIAGEVRSTLKPAKYGEAAVAGKTIELQSFRSYPVFDSLSLIEIYFMALWLLVMTWPLWNGLINRILLKGERLRIRSWRRRKLAAVVCLPLVAVLGWVVVYGVSTVVLQATSVKEALTAEKAQALNVGFTPISYGMAEVNNTEVFRPPSWRSSSRIDDEGYYEEGSASVRIDPETGIPVHGTQVLVRVGEPERNDSTRHMLGTDSLGRDILARMIWGARISLSVGLISTVLLVSIGTFLGSLAGYFGGWIDIVISRVIEVFQCFPVFFLILIVVSFLGPSILNIMLAIGIFRWTGVARLVRGEFIRLRKQDFVVASQALGAHSMRTIFRHVLPNAMGPVLVAATFAVASGILTESALSFLGFGVELPIPSWGALLVESKSPEYWWIQVFPGLAVFITVILYNMVGEGVRDALDPRLKEG